MIKNVHRELLWKKPEASIIFKIKYRSKFICITFPAVLKPYAINLRLINNYYKTNPKNLICHILNKRQLQKPFLSYSHHYLQSCHVIAYTLFLFKRPLSSRTLNLSSSKYPNIFCRVAGLSGRGLYANNLNMVKIYIKTEIFTNRSLAPDPLMRFIFC